MPLIDPAKARQFAELWIDAWNRHDLDAVLSHYTDDFQFSSPLTIEMAGKTSGILKGKTAVRAYWEKGLQQVSDLQFQLLDVLTGMDQLTLYYRGHRGTVTECFHIDGRGQVTLASASYGIDHASPIPLDLPALDPAGVPGRITSIYPTDELRSRIVGRYKQALGDVLDLQTFGVNRVTLAPGGISALRHWHTRQDEFIYVLEGEVTLIAEHSEQCLGADTCAGFPAGKSDGHQLINRGNRRAVYLEVGDRLPGDAAHYPDDDLQATAVRGAYVFAHKDGTPY